MKIAIYGYGNLGKGVECAAMHDDSVTITGVFTRRAPETVTTCGAPVYRADEIDRFQKEIDVVIICGGSATDLPQMTPALASRFCVVDSFDTHAKIPEHFAAVNAAAKAANTTALISAGWDPGMFSVLRVLSGAILPQGTDYTFWGRGVSQGHSDAIRRIEGVLDARQYTVPVENALTAVRMGENPTLTARQKHKRECYVVAKEGADKAEIERQIVTMPHYFADYDTTVTFISAEELKQNHGGMPHGGSVIRTGNTGTSGEHAHVIEYSLKLDSNPEFTASVLLAYAHAVCKMNARGDYGAKTVLHVSPADLSPLSEEELLAHYL